MTRKLAMLAVITLCFGCVPTHNVKPLPDFVNTAIQPGDKVIVTTKAGETIEFIVSEVTNEMLIGENHRIALEDVVAPVVLPVILGIMIFLTSSVDNSANLSDPLTASMRSILEWTVI